MFIEFNTLFSKPVMLRHIIQSLVVVVVVVVLVAEAVSWGFQW
jgi:hypothetical protein